MHNLAEKVKKGQKRMEQSLCMFESSLQKIEHSN
jgi:hypothetical protein